MSNRPTTGLNIYFMRPVSDWTFFSSKIYMNYIYQSKHVVKRYFDTYTSPTF